MSRKKINIMALNGWESLSSGTHNITLKSKAIGREDSSPSTSIPIAKHVYYAITPSLTNISSGVGNLTKLSQNGKTMLTYVADPGYAVPTTVSVTGATKNSWSTSYPYNIGKLTISNPTSNITLSMNGLVTYNIATVLSHVTASTGNPTIISQNRATTLNFSNDSGYVLPESVTVTGATIQEWSRNEGALTISNPTGDVTITINGEVSATFTQVHPTTTGELTKLSNMNTAKKYSIECIAGGWGGSSTIFNIQYNGSAWECVNIIPYGELNIESQTSTSITFKVGDVWNYFVEFTDGVMLEGDSFATLSSQFASFMKDTGVFANWGCIVQGTQITLADRTTKNIEDITYDDDLLVWDFYTGKFSSAKPKWIKIEEEATEYNLVRISDGRTIGFVGEGGSVGYHRVYNNNSKSFTHTGCVDTPDGTELFDDNGETQFICGQEVIKTNVKFYNIITERHYNLFANGILTSCRLSNKYKIDNMKYCGDRLITNDEINQYFEKRKSLQK